MYAVRVCSRKGLPVAACADALLIACMAGVMCRCSVCTQRGQPAEVRTDEEEGHRVRHIEERGVRVEVVPNGELILGRFAPVQRARACLSHACPVQRMVKCCRQWARAEPRCPFKSY